MIVAPRLRGTRVNRQAVIGIIAHIILYKCVSGRHIAAVAAPISVIYCISVIGHTLPTLLHRCTSDLRAFPFSRRGVQCATACTSARVARIRSYMADIYRYYYIIIYHMRVYKSTNTEGK